MKLCNTEVTSKMKANHNDKAEVTQDYIVV